MEIRLAKTAGFCFGVNRAVQLVDRLVDEGAKVATLGPLIHNPQGSGADAQPGCAGSGSGKRTCLLDTKWWCAATACPQHLR